MRIVHLDHMTIGRSICSFPFLCLVVHKWARIIMKTYRILDQCNDVSSQEPNYVNKQKLRRPKSAMWVAELHERVDGIPVLATVAPP